MTVRETTQGGIRRRDRKANINNKYATNTRQNEIVTMFKNKIVTYKIEYSNQPQVGGAWNEINQIITYHIICHPHEV